MDTMELNSKITIHTSYFAKYKGSNGVCIAIGAPWFKGERYGKLFPPRFLLEWWKSSNKTLNDIKVFEYIYKVEVLDKLDVHQVARELNGKVILCFEKYPEFCHRHLVSKWLYDNGYSCKEII